MRGQTKHLEQISSPDTSTEDRGVWFKQRSTLLDLIKNNKRVKKALYPLSLITALQTACAGELSQKDLAKCPFPQEAPEIIQQPDGSYCLDLHVPVCRGIGKGGHKTQEVCTCLNNLLPHEQDAIERLQLAAQMTGAEGPLKRFKGAHESITTEDVTDRDLVDRMGEQADTVIGFESLGIDNKVIRDLLKTLPGKSLESVLFSQECPADHSHLKPGQVILSSISDYPHNRAQITFYAPECQANAGLVYQGLLSGMSRNLVEAYVEANDYFGVIHEYPDEKANPLDIELRNIVQPTANPNLPHGPNLPSNYNGPFIPFDEFAELYRHSDKQCAADNSETKYNARRKKLVVELANTALHIKFRFPSQDWRQAFKEQLMGQYQTAEFKADEIVQFINHVFQKIAPNADPNAIIRNFQDKELVLNNKLTHLVYKKELEQQVQDQGIRALFTRAIDEPKGAVHPLMLMDELEKKSLYPLYAPAIHKQTQAEENLDQLIQAQSDESLAHLLMRLSRVCKNLLELRRQMEHKNINNQFSREFSQNLKLFNIFWSSLSQADKEKYKPYIIHYMRIKYYGDAMSKEYDKN